MHRTSKLYSSSLSRASLPSLCISLPVRLSSGPTMTCIRCSISQLSVIEIANNVVNKSLWAAIDSSSLPVWMRAQVANRLVTGGESWTSIFGSAQWKDRQFAMGCVRLFALRFLLLLFLFLPCAASINRVGFWEQMSGAVLSLSLDASSIVSRTWYWASFSSGPIFLEG